MNIAKEIVGWREDIRSMPPRSNALVALLCYGYNWATNPAVLRTDREHRACRTFGRWCWRRLSVLSGWLQSENGRLFVAPVRYKGGA